MSKFGSAVKTWATYNPSALTPWWSWLNARASHILMLAVLFLILAAHAPTDIVNIERSPAHQIIPGFDHAMCIAWLGPTFIFALTWFMVASPLSFVVSGYNQHLTKRVEYLTIHGDDHIARLAFKKQERFWVGVGMFSVVMLVALTLSLALYFEDREVMLHGTYLFFGISLIVTLVSIAIFKPIWAFGRICAFFVWISELRAGPTLARFEQLPIQVRQAAQSRATTLGIKVDDRAMMKETLLVYEKNKARIEAHARDLEQSTPSAHLTPPHRRL